MTRKHSNDRPAWQLSAVALADCYRSGQLSPVDALEAILERIAAVNPSLNAIVTLDPDGARRAAQASSARWRRAQPLGPLDGVPITIKDNLEVAGLRCTWGSRLFADHRPLEDELPVARLRAAGALILGKTNCSEFAMVGHTANEVFGATRNPWDTRLTAGGSSGGAVAAVAAGLGPLALGTDGGGSTRRPAAHCGLVGYKPTIGRLPRAGGLPAIFLDYEVIGPIARTVDDVVLLAQALAEPDPRDPASQAFVHQAFEPPSRTGPLRILHIRSFGDAPVEPDIAALTDSAAERFAALGHQVEHADQWPIAESVSARWMQLAQSGLAQMLSARGADPALLSPIAQASLDAGRALPATALFELLDEVAVLRQRLGQCLSEHDFLLTPATAAWPWPVERVYPDVIAGRTAGPRGHAVFTAFVNAAGLPAIALPCGQSASGLPNGLQLVGRWGDDARLLALARDWERIERGFEHWPGVPNAG